MVENWYGWSCVTRGKVTYEKASNRLIFNTFPGQNVTTISYNNTPWITIFTSSEMVPHIGKNLFDGNLNTMWLSNKTSGSNQIWYANLNQLLSSLALWKEVYV